MEIIHELSRLLLSFGPYAVLALFALWIAPARTKEFISSKTGIEKKYCCGVATGSWLIVLGMVAYITINWSPKQVSTGSLGKLNPEMQILPTPPSEIDLFVKNEGSGNNPSGSNRWGYALIKGPEFKNLNACAAFTVFWTIDNKDHTVDFEVPVKNLLSSNNIKFPFDLIDLTNTEEGKVVNYIDGHWQETGLCYEENLSANLDFIKAAHAESEKIQEISQNLQSDNSANRARARKHMRELSKNDLEKLQNEVPNNSRAYSVVSQEKERR